MNGNEVAVSGERLGTMGMYTETEGEGWGKKKKKETNNNAALNFGGRVSTMSPFCPTHPTNQSGFFFSFWRLKRKEMSKTN